MQAQTHHQHHHHALTSAFRPLQPPPLPSSSSSISATSALSSSSSSSSSPSSSVSTAGTTINTALLMSIRGSTTGPGGNSPNTNSGNNNNTNNNLFGNPFIRNGTGGVGGGISVNVNAAAAAAVRTVSPATGTLTPPHFRGPPPNLGHSVVGSSRISPTSSNGNKSPGLGGSGGVGHSSSGAGGAGGAGNGNPTIANPTSPSPGGLYSGFPESSDQVVHASVSHLLTRAYSLPCSTAAQAFSQLVQPTARFQLALDALLPLLDSAKAVELTQRILVSFILYSLYAPHPITINPFRSVLFVAYIKEKEKAIRVTDEGGTSPNEQLVWVLWKILKGDGNDIGPYSPSTLARSPLPPKLRAVNLVLDDDMYNGTADLDDVTYSYFQNNKKNVYGQPATSGYGNFNSNGTSNNSTISPTTPSSGISSSASSSFAGIGSITRTSPITTEEDRWNERVVQGMRLLLAARERALTLSEQRVLFPLINDVTSSRMITSLDFTPIVSRNPTIAHPLFVGLLTNASSENANISHFLDILPFLPPTLSSMDLMGRLLRDQTRIDNVNVPGYSTVADLVRMEVLGRFIHEGIEWVERAERDEREGLVSDDRFSKGVQNLCRFFNSLIKMQIVDPSSDADCAEMAHFTLRYSRFEEANVLYRLLAMSRY